MSATLAIPIHTQRVLLDPPLSDDEFEQMAMESDFLQLERTKEGVIKVNAPAGFNTGDGNSEIIRQLRNWWIVERKGRISDSNTGFFLPDSSSLSPDAAFVSAERLAGRGKKDTRRFLRACPDFVIELLSESDSLSETQEKMAMWIANGALLGWLVDPYRKTVHIYQPGNAPEIVIGGSVSGTGAVSGFVLDLTEIWSCYED